MRDRVPGGPWVVSAFVSEPLQTILVLDRRVLHRGALGHVRRRRRGRLDPRDPRARRHADRGDRQHAARRSSRRRSAGRCATTATGSSTCASCSGPRSSGAGAAVGGALLADLVPGDGHLLMILTAALLAFTAYRTGQSPKRPDPADAEELPPSEDPDFADVEPLARRGRGWSGGGSATIGLAAGLLSGLLGVGGGILMVPAFVGWVRLPIKEAVGCSLACVGILAVPGHDHARSCSATSTGRSRSRSASR